MTSTPEATIVGNDTITRATCDAWANFHLIDTGNAMPKDGHVLGWSVFAKNTNTVQLLIYRPTGDTYEVIGRSELMTPVVGVNEFTLGEPIAVKAGDLLGWHFGETGSVPYDAGSGGPVRYTNGTTETTIVGADNRTYSIQVRMGQLVPDDLTKIEGVGPKIKGLLHDAGLLTYAQVAAVDSARIDEILDAAGKRYATANPGTWPQQAALAAAGKWDELKALQDQLDGGVKED